MNIAILHRVPFEKARYNEIIDHNNNQVFYLGLSQALNLLPKDLSHSPIAITSLDATDEIVRRLRFHKIDHIIALSEYDLLTAAHMREELNIPGPRVPATLIVRDKILMKQAVAKAGIRCPRNQRLDEGDVYKNWPMPLVLKPVDGASSEGVEVYHDRNLLQKRLMDIAGDERAHYEIEEYVSGPVYHFDGWVKDGAIMDFVPSRYVGTCYEYLKGAPLGSHQILDGKHEMKAWSQNIIASVGIKSGAFHLEAIQYDGAFYFLEIAHRVGGAGVAQTFERRTGINLYHAHIASALNLPIRSTRTEAATLLYGWFVFPGHHFTSPYCSIVGSETLFEMDNVFNLTMTRPSEKLPIFPKLSYQAHETPLSGLVFSGSESHIHQSILDIFLNIKVVGINDGDSIVNLISVAQ